MYAAFALVCLAALCSAHVVEKQEWPSKPMNEWSLDEVKMWLEKAHLGMFKMFNEEKIKEAVDKWYCPDAKFIQNNGDVILGKDELRMWFTEKMSNWTLGYDKETLSTAEVTWHSDDLWTSEEMMLDHSCVIIKMKDTEFSYRTITLWTMKDGEWKIKLDTCFSKWHE